MEVKVVFIHTIDPLGDFLTLKFPHDYKPIIGQYLANDKSIWKIAGIEVHAKYNATVIRPKVKTVFTCRVIPIKSNIVVEGEVFYIKNMIVTT